MATFKEFSSDDISTSKDYLTQLVDILDTDVTSTDTRRKSQVFVTGGLGPGVTSSIFQTVYDQNFTLQTANPVFDITMGLAVDSPVVTATSPTVDANGKYLFPQTSLMMREKLDVYRLFAQDLLGDGSATFTARAGNNTAEIKEAMFICFKRLFARDQVKRETFAIRLHTTASNNSGDNPDNTNLFWPATSTTQIYTDISSSVNKEYTFGGQVSTVVDSSDTTYPLGLLFLDRGVLVLDVSRSFDQAQVLSGTIDAVTVSGDAVFEGTLGEFLASGSMDDILDHLAGTKFGEDDEAAITFQNVTNINSTLYFVNIAADEFNYSSNPTFTDADNRIVVIDEGQEDVQQTFTFITSIGLYDAYDNLLGVAKVSRPVLNAPDRNVSLRVRLDY